MRKETKLSEIEQDCFKCEKTFKSEKYQDCCNECLSINERIKPSTIKVSELAKQMGISFTQF